MIKIQIVVIAKFYFFKKLFVQDFSKDNPTIISLLPSCLIAPYFTKIFEHGLRFWDYPPLLLLIQAKKSKKHQIGYCDQFQFFGFIPRILQYQTFRNLCYLCYELINLSS